MVFPALATVSLSRLCRVNVLKLYELQVLTTIRHFIQPPYLIPVHARWPIFFPQNVIPTKIHLWCVKNLDMYSLLTLCSTDHLVCFFGSKKVDNSSGRLSNLWSTLSNLWLTSLNLLFTSSLNIWISAFTSSLNIWISAFTPVFISQIMKKDRKKPSRVTPLVSHASPEIIEAKVRFAALLGRSPWKYQKQFRCSLSKKSIDNL